MKLHTFDVKSSTDHHCACFNPTWKIMFPRISNVHAIVYLIGAADVERKVLLRIEDSPLFQKKLGIFLYFYIISKSYNYNVSFNI